MDSATAQHYLARFGGSRHDDVATLQEKHLMAVPFENLAIHLGEPIALDETALVHKIVAGRRGGFCFELNNLFGALLTALGYSVTQQAARIWMGNTLGPPLEHLALLVDDQLVDVGIGRSARRPLRWSSRRDQPDAGSVYRLVDAADGDVDVVCDGVPLCRVERRPREIGDFAAMCWWQQHSPESPFVAGPICTRLTHDGRITLAGTKLITTRSGDRHEVELTADEVLDAYLTNFGIALERLPAARQAVGAR